MIMLMLCESSYARLTPEVLQSPLIDNLVLRMTTGSRSFASNARGMGMKKKSKDQGHLIVANGGGAQHTKSGDGMDGIH